MTSPGRAGQLDGACRRTLHRTIAAFVAAFLLAGCGGPARSDAETGTVLVDLALAQTLPPVLDSGMRVRGEVTVRTDEPDGVRVWLRPNESPGEDLDFSYAGSGLIEGPEFTVERNFRVFAGDDDLNGDPEHRQPGAGPAGLRRAGVRLLVTITDPTDGLIYTKDVDVDLAFDEPSP